MGSFERFASFRQELVEKLRRQVFGPSENDAADALTERLSVSPLQLYATGVLFPQKLRQDLLEDSPEANTAEEGHVVDVEPPVEPPVEPTIDRRRHDNDTGSDSTSSEREPLNLANEYSPSATGISFRLASPVPLVARITYGVYEAIKTVEPHPRAGDVGLDGETYPPTLEATRYQRIHFDREVRLALGSHIGALPPIDVGDGRGLYLHVTVRQRLDGTTVVSTMLVNHQSATSTAVPSYEDAFFQVAISVGHENGDAVFLPIDRNASGAEGDPELASMDLLYRHRRAFALGHGAAGDWNRNERLSEDGRTDMVRSAPIPTYELKPIKPRETAFRTGAELKLSMAFLHDGGGQPDVNGVIVAELENLAGDYRLWIEQQETMAREAKSPLDEAAASNLDYCRRCHARILRGIHILKSDNAAMLAFRLMNKAMLISTASFSHATASHRFPYSRTDYIWKGQQVAAVSTRIHSDERRFNGRSERP